VMEDIDNHLEELEEFSNSIRETQELEETVKSKKKGRKHISWEDEVTRYRDMDIEYEEGDVDELMLEGLQGHAPPIMEPALIVCWFIVGVVSFYVAWLGVMGAGPHRHDEL